MRTGSGRVFDAICVVIDTCHNPDQKLARSVCLLKRELDSKSELLRAGVLAEILEGVNSIDPLFAETLLGVMTRPSDFVPDEPFDAFEPFQPFELVGLSGS